MLLLLYGCAKPCVEHGEPCDAEDETSCLDQPLVDAHNAERAKVGARELRPNTKLQEIAQTHAEWMAKHQSLEHQSLDKIMKDWNTGGENIANGQRSVTEVMNSWMYSSGHKRNILNKSFSDIGCGRATARNGAIYWCVDFGG